MRIGLAQINPTVGDVAGNARKIVKFVSMARDRGAELVVFPELCVVGYPPMDLLEHKAFLESADYAMQWIAGEIPSEIGVILGNVRPTEAATGRRIHNSAILLSNGRIVGEAAKQLLPTYDVFDEFRYFEPGSSTCTLDWKGVRIGLHVCEDMWNNESGSPYHRYSLNPVDELARAGAELFINISASPFALGKLAERDDIIREYCLEHRRPFVYVNQVGANTELIFDGTSVVFSPDGDPVVRLPSFEEALDVWDSDSSVRTTVPVASTDVEQLHDALTLGIADYYNKTGVFESALVGLSGGIDSAVTCALAVNALGAENVRGVTMPSRFSSTGSVEDSYELAERLGITIHTIAIEPAVSSFEEMLGPLFEGTARGVAEENIQARSRGVTLMAISNKFGDLLLTTGNKSELATGYATLYGDMSGGLAVLSDVFKTQVWELARFINRRACRDLIPRAIIDKPPSAELRPDQLDSDSLPEYPVLDRILALYIEESLGAARIAEMTGYDRDLITGVIGMVDRNEYKRRQAPPGLRVTGKAFGIGRRIPIVMRRRRLSAVQAELRPSRPLG